MEGGFLLRASRWTRGGLCLLGVGGRCTCNVVGMVVNAEIVETTGGARTRRGVYRGSWIQQIERRRRSTAVERDGLGRL